MVAARAPPLVEFTHGLGQEVEGLGVIERARHEADALAERTPDVLPERRARALLHGLVDDLAEVLVGPVAAGEPDEREAGREETTVGEVVDRRHELLGREVAGDAEQHEAARSRDAGEPLVAGVPKGVVGG